MDFDKIRDIIKLFDDSKANYLELEDDGFYLKLQEKSDKVIQSVSNAPVPPQVPAVIPAIHDIADSAPKEPKGISENKSNYHTIKSPMVGTFYRAPSPDSEPYVEIGQKVKSGDTLCIIEAMKLMNEIDSDLKGTIAEILVENADPVEYNQPLFLIKPE